MKIHSNVRRDKYKVLMLTGRHDLVYGIVSKKDLSEEVIFQNLVLKDE